MPRNTLTHGGTMFVTAQGTNKLHEPSGHVLEMLCYSSEDVVRISGFAQAISDLNLPSDVIDDSLYFEKTLTPKNEKKQGKKTSPRADVVSIIHRGNDYITMCVPVSLISRYELHDRLNFLKWSMKVANFDYRVEVATQVDYDTQMSDGWCRGKCYCQRDFR